MALNFRSFHLMILALLLASFYLDFSAAALGGGGGPKTGGYQPIKNLNDPEVQEIAKYAVDEYNKNAQRELKYEKVVKGDTQVVSGTNYKLVIVAKDGGDASKQYEAIVWEKPWNKFRKLLSFTELN